jgi:hypothetical protein
MTQLKAPKKPLPDWEAVRDEWVRDVNALVDQVEAWCRAKDWPTRRIEKRIEESKIGEYVVPALLFQVDLLKLMLEPAARFASGCNGVVDLYVMPGYDYPLRIVHINGCWVALVLDAKERQPGAPFHPPGDAADPRSARWEFLK